MTEELLAAVPTDDSVLNTLTYVLRPVGRLRELTPAYEAAVAKEPGNQELLQGLFGSYVRCGARAARRGARAVAAAAPRVPQGTPATDR